MARKSPAPSPTSVPTPDAPLDDDTLSQIEARAAALAKAAAARGARRGIREALEDLAAVPAPAVAPAPDAARKVSGIRRPSAAMAALADRAAVAVAEAPGNRAKAIAAAMGEGLLASDIREPLAALKTAGRIHATGRKQGTKYWPGPGPVDPDAAPAV